MQGPTNNKRAGKTSTLTTGKASTISANRKAIDARLTDFSTHDTDYALKAFHSSKDGLTAQQVEDALDEHGENIITKYKKKNIFLKFLLAFANPFTAILLILAVIKLVMDIILPLNKGEKADPASFIIITVMVLIAGLIKFFQELKSGNAAEKLAHMITTSASVVRQGSPAQEVPMAVLVPGDIVKISAGDMVPADLRIIFAKDLFINQSALTGESEPVEKQSNALTLMADNSVTGYNNLAFTGTNVISGSGLGLILTTGDNTLMGDISQNLNVKAPKTAFTKGINSVSWVFVIFTLIMAPLVFVINGFTKNDWLGAFTFAISIAIGLTPEMLPTIVTACQSKGALIMSKKKVIIKDLSAIQNLGSMDVLCTDKTGTLTQDRVVLEQHLNIEGLEDTRVLKHGFLNSYFQTGLKNLMDVAIIDKAKELLGATDYDFIVKNYKKVDEIPFDFDRRRMSVVVKDNSGKTQLVTKGAMEEMLKISTKVSYKGQIVDLTEDMRRMIAAKITDLNSKGMRVLGVSQKTNPPEEGSFAVKDESAMVLIGYLAFYDPPKDSTPAAIQAMAKYGVKVKILTGDNEFVTRYICQQVGLDASNVLLGGDLDNLSMEELKTKVETTTIFAKLSPTQKALIINVLHSNGHVVGYMGDGINDANAMKVADVSVSVDSSVDIAKEEAKVILLEKDLLVLKDGIVEGRRTYANMIKYIKITASSNFGNMFSMIVASAWLPFLPMQATQLLILNLVYDISCSSIPWDHVDEDFLAKPTVWDASSISKFMIWIGPTSSVFDITTYLLLFYSVCPAVLGQQYGSLTTDADKMLFAMTFNAGWFVESMWTQSFIIHLLRTKKVPFIQSRSSWQLLLTTALGTAIITAIPFIPGLNAGLELSPLPGFYFGYLVLTMIAYVGLVSLMKYVYIKRYKAFL